MNRSTIDKYASQRFKAISAAQPKDCSASIVPLQMQFTCGPLSGGKAYVYIWPLNETWGKSIERLERH